MNTVECVTESNRIEGIVRAPTTAEIAEHERILGLKALTLDDLVAFVKVYQPDARLRDVAGLDVRIGGYYPPQGGPEIRLRLEELLVDVNKFRLDPFQAHVAYEMLHPFTDGNGRSGRALWYWMMVGQPWMASLGFLHAFYYQTLRYMQIPRSSRLWSDTEVATHQRIAQ